MKNAITDNAEWRVKNENSSTCAMAESPYCYGSPSTWKGCLPQTKCFVRVSPAIGNPYLEGYLGRGDGNNFLGRVIKKKGKDLLGSYPSDWCSQIVSIYPSVRQNSP